MEAKSQNPNILDYSVNHTKRVVECESSKINSAEKKTKIEKKKLSDYWGYFEKKKIDGQEFMCCKFCSKKYVLDTSLTNLKYHYDRHHAIKKSEVKDQKKIDDHYNKIECKTEECNLLLIK